MKQIIPHYSNKELTLAIVVGLLFFSFPTAFIVILAINLSIFAIQYLTIILIGLFVIISSIFIYATNRYIETLKHYNEAQTPLTTKRSINLINIVGITLIFIVIITIYFSI
ncbi:MAG: hypothetical protein K9L74_00435 [Candidatus Izimaplasma sp.]|nr:hypothetical protein [Candidatus Izimaplasma bacterium]